MKMQSEGKVMEAFDQYYADDCVVIEMPTGDRREGKEAQRQAIQEWFGQVKEHHGGGVGAMTANEETGTTCCESWFDITFTNGHRHTLREVAVQQWQDGKIKEEKFYYQQPTA